MARTKKQEPKQEKQEKQDKQDAVVTRAEKKDAARNLIKEVLSMQPLKHNDLLDETAKLYSQRYGADTDNPNDVKGRIGSVLDIMKKESEVAIDGGVYALKARLPMPAPTAKKAEKSVKKSTKKSVKAEETQAKSTEEKTEEKPAKKAEIKEEILTPPTAKEEKEKVEP